MALRRISIINVDRLGLLALIDDVSDLNERAEGDPMGKRVKVEVSVRATNLDDATDTTEAVANYGNMSFESFQNVEDALIDALRGLRQKAPAPAA